jgi:hypothetical protein
MRHATNRQKATYLARELFQTFKVWLVVLGVVAGSLCFMGAGSAWIIAHNQVPDPHVSGVEIDTATVARLMPELGTVAEAHWRWRDEWSTRGGTRKNLPAFNTKLQDVTFEGFALLSREKVATLLARRLDGELVIRWTPADDDPNSDVPPPPIPGSLARFGPPAPSWLVSWNFPDKPSGVWQYEIWLDDKSRMAFFVHQRRCPRDRMPCDAGSF